MEIDYQNLINTTPKPSGNGFNSPSVVDEIVNIIHHHNLKTDESTIEGLAKIFKIKLSDLIIKELVNPQYQPNQ